MFIPLRALPARLRFRQPDPHRPGVGLEPLGGGQRLDHRRQRRQRPRAHLHHAHAAAEGGHRERRGEAGRAGGGQHVARAGHVVADGLGRRGCPRRPPRPGRAAARAGAASFTRSTRCSGANWSASFTASAMPAVRRRWRPAPRWSGGRSPRGAAPASWRITSAWVARGHRARWWSPAPPRRARRARPGRAGRRPPRRASALRVGQHQDLARPGDHVDVDRAEDEPLGGRHVGVARAADLVDRRDGGGPVGQRRHRLGPAHPEEARDPGDVAGGQRPGVDVAGACGRRGRPPPPRRRRPPGPGWRS